MGDNTQKPALAEVKRFPKNSYLCIEFPGYIKNQDKALETLGGISALVEAHAAKQSQIPLNLRPNDPWSHPIFLDRYLTSNFVLEVTRTTDPNSGEVQVKGDIVGTIPQVYTFTGLADYQYLPPQLNEPPLDPMEDRSPLRGDYPTPQHFPPPIFSKTDHAHPYRFEGNPSFKLIERKDENGETVREFVRKRAKVPLNDETLPNIQFEAEGVPQAPPTEPMGTLDQELVALLRTLFEQHPVWSRPVLEYQLSKYPYNTTMIPCLYQVAYTFASGPWRLCWVKLGFDPRLDPNCRRYQLLDFRVTKQQTRGEAAVNYYRKPLSDKPARLNARSLDVVLKNRNHLASLLLSHRQLEYQFKKPPSQQQTGYWIHELHLDGLEAIIARPPAPRCTKETGWFTAQNFKEIRALMKRKLPDLIQEWDSGDFEAKLKAAEEEANLEYDDTEGQTTGENEAPAFGQLASSSQETTEVPNFLTQIAKSAAGNFRTESLEQMADQLAEDSDQEFALLEDD